MIIDRRRFLTTSGAGLAGLGLAGLRAQAQQPPDQQDVLYSFVAVADPHLRENREGQLTGADKFRSVLDAVARLQPAPDFMLLLGDIHPEVLETLLAEVPLPIHAVAGNHENRAHRELLRSMFPQDFEGRDFYRFEHRGDLFIGVCNAAVGDHVGHFETESNVPAVGQGEWLEEQLAGREEFPRVFVFGHIPPEQNNRPNTMCLAQNDSRWLHEQVTSTQPTALFFGHRHRRIFFDIAGVPVYGIRSCNWNSGDEPCGFQQVLVTPQEVSLRFIETRQFPQ